VRRPNQLRVAALLGASAAVAFALLIALLAFLALGRAGRLGFAGFNAPGILEGALFVLAYSGALIYVRSALRLPSPTLLSFGLLAPPTTGRSAAKVPVVDAAQVAQTMMANRIVIVQDAGVPVGVTGLHHDRITSWEELVKVEADMAVTDLRRLLAHEQLVVVLEGAEVRGIVTQEMYLAGLWGSVR